MPGFMTGCRKCGGKGRINITANDVKRGMKKPKANEDHTRPCPYCYGKGYQTEEWIDRTTKRRKR